jgi:hypothetical protein
LLRRAHAGATVLVTGHRRAVLDVADTVISVGEDVDACR